MTAPWPEGVIARYLTVGGATVDMTHQYNVLTPPEAYATLASCTGCPATSEHSHYRMVWGMTVQREEHHPGAADRDALVWAQAHAEKCRAMPKPTTDEQERNYR
jgi:GMP synthase-like glutamine amidotransferase